MDFVDLEITSISLTVECGSLNLSECILIKAGLNSRIAAREVVRKGQGKFQDYDGMRAWLRELPRDENWPTPETTKEWKKFIERTSKKRRKLEIKTWETSCKWSDQINKIPQVGSKLRIKISGKNLSIYSPDFQFLGDIDNNRDDISTSANIWATVISENKLKITYIG